MRYFRLPPKPVAILSLLALLAVPLVLGMLILSMASLPGMLGLLSDSSFSPPTPKWLNSLAWQRRVARYTPEQRQLIGADVRESDMAHDGRAHLGRLAAAYPESLPVQTRWTLYQVSLSTLPLPEKLALLEKVEKADPENSLWPLQRAHCLMSASAKLEDLELPPGVPRGTPNHQRLTISDQAQFDQGVAELRRGLAMPKYDARFNDLLQMQLDAFGQVRDVADGIAQASLAAGSLIPELSWMKQQVGFSVSYGEALLSQGKVEEARPLLRSWLPLAEKQLRSDDSILINALVAGAMLRQGQLEEEAWRQAGRAAEADRAAALWTAAYAPMEAFRKSKTTAEHETFVANAGVLPAVLLPGLRGCETPPLAEAFAWRQLEYLQVCETGGILFGMLSAFWLVLAGSLVFLRFFQQEDPPDIPCPWTEFRRPLLWSLLPLALYLLVERGFYVREIFFVNNAQALHCVIGAGALWLALAAAVLLPTFACWSWWRQGGGRWLLIPSALMLACCALVCFSTSVEIPRLVRQAKFMHQTGDGLPLEAGMARRLKQSMLQAAEAAQQKPSPAKGP